MSESKHTAGPWVANQSRHNPEAYDITPAASNGLGWVTLPDEDPSGVGVYMQVGGICSAADARLIAAAPELLEALDWLVSCLGDGSLQNDGGFYLAKARAAILKATGGEA